MGCVEPIKNKNDLKKLENYFMKKNKRDYVLFTIGINCGLRISDILKLNVENVKNKNYIELFEKKTGKFKKFPLNSKLKLILDEYTKDKQKENALFLTKYKNRLDRISAYKILNKACKETNLEIHVGTHTLRKTFGYHFYKQFKDIVILQKIFNHSTPNVTLRYIGLEQEEIDEKYLQFIL